MFENLVQTPCKLDMRFDGSKSLLKWLEPMFRTNQGNEVPWLVHGMPILKLSRSAETNEMSYRVYIEF